MSSGMFLVDYEQPLYRLIRRKWREKKDEEKKVATRNLWARSTFPFRASYPHILHGHFSPALNFHVRLDELNERRAVLSLCSLGIKLYMFDVRIAKLQMQQTWAALFVPRRSTHWLLTPITEHAPLLQENCILWPVLQFVPRDFWRYSWNCWLCDQ